MPILGVPVSLGEVLENSSPLREADIWGVLCQGAEAIQDLFFRGEAIQDGVANFVITLDTLLLSPNGRAQFSESSQTKNVSNFIAPEIHTGILMSEAAIEKIYVYSLGKTLQVAIDYSLKKDPSLTISRNLESILNAMCERNPSLRIALIHVLEACSLQSQRRTVTRTPSFSQSVARLAKTVTGTQADLSYWSYDSYNYNYNYNNNSGSSSDQSRQSTLNRRSLKSRRASRRNRRRNGSGRNHKEKDRSRSRSPARSSSRSRSRSSYSNAGNVENLDPREDKTTDTSSTSSQSTVRTTHTTASPKRRPSTNSRPSSLHIPSNGSMTTTIPMPTMSSCASQARSDTSQHSYGSSCSSRHRRSPSSLFGAKVDIANHLANNPAYDRYLRLKDRQRKLQALQKNPSDEIGFWGSDNSDGYSDTRSVTSGISVMQDEADHCLQRPGDKNNANNGNHWSFLPDLSSEYGPDMALKLGPRGSDRDSIISSEMSFFQHDPNAMRSEMDPTPMYASPSLKSMTEQALHSNNHPTRYSHVPRSPSSSILGSLADDYSTGNKEYNGPEFICRGRKPLVKLNMPLSGESLKNTANARRVIIVLLNGQKLEAMCDPSTTGKQLFQTLISHTGLQEIQSYFGLTYMHDGEHFFLDQDTKLHKVAPDGWREGGKGQAAITFILFFRIKYYGNTVLDTNHQNLLYLQLRQDILEERLECDENRALTLAAFALQVECGDYQKEMMGRNYFVPDYYFSKRILQLYGTGFIRDHTPDAHRSICGLSQDDAMVKFIRLVQELPEYGTHFHKVYKTKNENPNSVSWIGIGAHSMIIAENLKKERVIVDRQPWDMVDKLSFKGKRVTVQIKPDPSVGGKPSKVYFYTNSHRKGRYLLQMSTDQHKFQLKLLSQSSVTSPTQNSKPFEPPMFADIAFADLEEEDEDDEMFQLSSPVSPLPNEDQNVPVQLSGSMIKPNCRNSSYDLHDSPISIPSNHLFSSMQSLENLAPVQSPACLHEMNFTCLKMAQFTGSSPYLSHTSLHEKYFNDHPHAPLRVSLSPVPPLNLPSFINNSNNNHTISTTGTTISTTSHVLDFSDYDGSSNGAKSVSVKEVVLKKDDTSSIGISFVAGAIPGTGKSGANGSSKHSKQPTPMPAIFVDCITPGSPADLSGHIQSNDQILAVNGSTVTGLSCQDIINRIEQSGHSIQLLLLQRSQQQTTNEQSVRTSNEPHAKLQSSPPCIIPPLPTDQSWSRSANDFVLRNSRTSPSRRHSSGSTLDYFYRDPYIPEHRASVPSILEAVQDTNTSSTTFFPPILPSSISSLQKSTKPKSLSTMEIPLNSVKRQTNIGDFRSQNGIFNFGFPQFTRTLPSNSSLPSKNQRWSSTEFLSAPLASSTPASSPSSRRINSSSHRRMSLISAKRLLAKQNKQMLFRQKTGSIRKERLNEKFYECFLFKQDGSLGLNIIGGVDTKTDLGGVYVKSLRANGSAEKQGTIKPGDRIIQINSINLEEVRHEQAVRILHECPTKCLLVLGRSSKPVLPLCPPTIMINGMVTAEDVNPRELVKEEVTITSRKMAQVEKNWKPENSSSESSMSEVSSSMDYPHAESELALCNKEDIKPPKRTTPNKSEMATSEQSATPEPHGVTQDVQTVPVDTRIKDVKSVQGVPPTIMEGSSEDLQLKDNEDFTYQKSGATKNEGIPKEGLQEDSTFSDERDKKVPGTDYKRWKHFGNGACLWQEPPNSVVISAERGQSGSHAKDDSPIHQNTDHGSDGPTCSLGGIPPEDTSYSSPESKMTLTTSQPKDYRGVVSLETDLGGSQSESAPKGGDPMSIDVVNTTDGSSTLGDKLTPNQVNPSNENEENMMQQCSDAGRRSSDESLKPKESTAEKNESLNALNLGNTHEPPSVMATRSEMTSLASANVKDVIRSESGGKLASDYESYKSEEQISESLSSPRKEKIPLPLHLKFGPTSDKNPFNNLSWLWEVPLVRSPEVINHDRLNRLLNKLENSLRSRKYLEEFQLIKRESFSNIGRTKVALMAENKAKNRCQENVPYDNARYILSGSETYINASHVRVNVGKMQYHTIAAQSPLSNTVVDFWKMIWESNASVVVMLSHEVELGRNKCFRYWPDNRDKPLNVEEKYQVTLTERHNLPGFDVRLLQLSCQSGGNQHRVMQFMYKAWPFRGTPSSPVSLLQLAQAVQFCHLATAKDEPSTDDFPVIIHCITGSGRSAVFIAVYTALLHIQNNIEFDIFALVKNLRLQRPHMVETQAEYKFCYTAAIRALSELLCPPYGEMVSQTNHDGQ